MPITFHIAGKCHTFYRNTNATGFFARGYKKRDCPPCEPKKPPKLPLTARQFKEKECHPCAYQFESKKIEDVPCGCPDVGCECKAKPCPPETMKPVNQCPKKKDLKCPEGDWPQSGQ